MIINFLLKENVSTLLVYTSLPALNGYHIYVTHVALATSCLAVSWVSFSLLLDIVGIPQCPVHPSALDSPQLSCTEEFQAIFLTFIFPLGLWPEFPTACWVFHSHLKLHVSNGEEFTCCYLLTFLSVNDHHPPGWTHTCFSVPSAPYPISHFVLSIFSVLINMTYLLTAKYTLHFPTANLQFYLPREPSCLLIEML